MGDLTEESAVFSRAEMDKYVEHTGKSLGCTCKKSVPTGLKKVATLLKGEYLREIESYDDQRHFLCIESAITCDPHPNNVFLA